jgi:DNA-3-methyladenine glycosylase
MGVLKVDFYIRADVVKISKDLLGKFIFTNFNGACCGGIITETEAYAGVNDRASHAFGGRRTARNEMMYSKGGVAYVYFCYGVHYMLNFVTHTADVPHAILLRGIHPIEGLDLMASRRGKNPTSKDFSNGPGKVTRALGVNLGHNGLELTGHQLWIEDKGLVIPDKNILIGPRIGVDYAGEDARLPYRFRVDGIPHNTLFY